MNASSVTSSTQYHTIYDVYLVSHVTGTDVDSTWVVAIEASFSTRVINVLITVGDWMQHGVFLHALFDQQAIAFFIAMCSDIMLYIVMNHYFRGNGVT